MKDTYIAVKSSEAKKLAEIIREEIVENDCPHSYVFGDAKYRLREMEPLLRRLEDESAAYDVMKPIEQLKNTSAMLAVMLEDIYEFSPNSVKDRVCKEIGNLQQCIRDTESKLDV